MNKLIEFAKQTRTTKFFRNYAIAEIKVAYRCMEYLASDAAFPPDDLLKRTIVFLQNQMFEEAAEEIIKETDVNLDSAHWREQLFNSTVELLKYLYPEYQKKITVDKEIRKQELLKELEELERAHNQF